MITEEQREQAESDIKLVDIILAMITKHTTSEPRIVAILSSLVAGMFCTIPDDTLRAQVIALFLVEVTNSCRSGIEFTDKCRALGLDPTNPEDLEIYDKLMAQPTSKLVH